MHACTLLRFAAVVIAALVGFTGVRSAAAAEDHSGDCEPPHHEEQPAAGHWTGFFRMSFELMPPNLPPTMKITVNWGGDMSFDLGRAEGEDDPPPAPPPPPPRRRPLGVPPPTSALPPSMFENCCNEEQAAAILAAEQQHEAENDAAVQKILQWYAENLPPQHLQVMPGKNAIIKGTSKVSMQTSFGGAVSGTNIGGRGQGSVPADYDLKGEETDPHVGFTAIELWGIPGLMDFAGSAMMSGRGGSATVDVAMDRGGMRGHAQGRDNRGRTADADYSGANPMTPGDKTRLADLKIEERKCWLLSGKVDESVLRERFASSGTQIRVIESEWMATLDERDPDWEKQVEQLAAEPIPADLTWDYIDSFKTRWSALRGIGRLVMSDYKRCVLKKLEEKFIRINMAALRVYVDNFPKFDESATCVVMRTALQRILPLMQLLELYGVTDCPLMQKALTVASTEMQHLLKDKLSRKYTMRDLECFIGAYKSGLLDFGDQTADFEAALAAVTEAAGRTRPAN